MFTLPLTVPKPATTGALPKLMFGVVIWQSLVTVRLIVRFIVPSSFCRPRQRFPTPMPQQ
ncbi:hypothetical protein D3C80_2021830 [compost metagenome]